jgi:hypothetical protein
MDPDPQGHAEVAISSGAGSRVGKPDKVSSRVGGGVNVPNPLVVEELAFFFLGFCADSADDDGDTRFAFRHRPCACWLVNPLANPHQRVTKIAAAAVVLMVSRCSRLCNNVLPIRLYGRCRAFCFLVVSYDIY